MLIQCPKCKARRDIPDEYDGQQVKCIQCKQPFNATWRPLPIFPSHVQKIITKAFFYVLVAQGLIFYPFLQWEYASSNIIIARYISLLLLLTGLSLIAIRKVESRWPSIRNSKSRFLQKGFRATICFLCVPLLIYYAKNDYSMEHSQRNGYDIYDKYKLWTHDHVHRSIYSKDFGISWSENGPMATRPGTYESKQHGMWETTSYGKTADSFFQKYIWYWYGEEITEDQWISRNGK